MAKYDYDLFVVGGGSGGVRAARMAAAAGVRVALAEGSKLGGTCVNLGCIPKKLYVYASEFGAGFQQVGDFGWQMQKPEFHWSTLRDNKTAELTRLNGLYRQMLDRADVQILQGHARLLDEHRVDVAGRTYSARRILLASGSRPFLPEVPGGEFLLSSDQIFDLDRLPQRLLIVGGGYIAGEFSGIFHGLGVKVTQIYRGALFLRGFDREVRQFVAEQMRGRGIDLRFHCELKKIQRQADGSFLATLDDGKTLATDVILAATGRVANTLNLGLETLGVKLSDQGAVLVDDFYQTNIPSIYALGDVIDHLQLTPVALAQAMTLVQHLYQGGTRPLTERQVPSAVFCEPNIATVGLTEEQAQQQYAEVDVYTTSFRPLKHALSRSGERVFIKLLVDTVTDKVIGAHMAGEGAGEIIQGIAVALQAGATKADFDTTLGVHPTSAEEFVTLRNRTRRVGTNINPKEQQ
ncbi:MAG: glutathione-disulfide reductase [Deltaproteobacteria bacterium]|nr:glutathione-disulfide reductase [Deltaproteobacteria bacterium]NCP02424.1 glutathione-disulfide reductase [Deltaproteobacteria bacterium]